VAQKVSYALRRTASYLQSPESALHLHSFATQDKQSSAVIAHCDRFGLIKRRRNLVGGTAPDGNHQQNNPSIAPLAKIQVGSISDEAGFRKAIVCNLGFAGN
jgi:hypothetical protein